RGGHAPPSRWGTPGQSGTHVASCGYGPRCTRMRTRISLIAALVLVAALLARVLGLFPGLAADAASESLERQRARLVYRMAIELRLTPEQLGRVSEIISASPVAGQGNPTLTVHPMTREECWQRRAQAGELAEASPECG